MSQVGSNTVDYVIVINLQNWRSHLLHMEFMLRISGCIWVLLKLFLVKMMLVMYDHNEFIIVCHNNGLFFCVHIEALLHNTSHSLFVLLNLNSPFVVIHLLDCLLNLL